MKKCEKCGKEFQDDVKFCDVCGSPVVEAVETTETPVEDVQPAEAPAETPAEAPAETPAKGRGLNKTVKLVIVAAAAVVLLLVVGLIVRTVLLNGKSSVNRNAVNIVFASDENTYLIDGKGNKKKLFEGYGTIVSTNADDTKILVSDSEKNLYFASMKKIDLITDEYNDAVLSFSGDGAVIYVEEDYPSGSIYLYNSKKGTYKKIDEDVRGGSAVVSPDGKTVAYVGNYKDNNSYKLYVSVNGKEGKEISKAGVPYAVSNGGKFLYSFKYDSDDGTYDFYVTKNLKKGQKLASELKYPGAWFNKTLSEVIFYNDGKTYSSVKGKEANKLSSNSFNGIYTKESDFTFHVETYLSSCTITSLKTFKKSIVKLGSDAYIIKNVAKTVEKVASNPDLVQLSKDGKSLIYLNGYKVYKVKNVNKPEKKLFFEIDDDDYDIDAFYFLTDLSGFYLESDDELYICKGKKLKEIAKEVSKLKFDPESNSLYFFCDYDSEDTNHLYRSTKGSAKKTVIKDVYGTISRVSGNYFYLIKENEKDEDLLDMYLLKGKKAKILFKQFSER